MSCLRYFLPFYFTASLLAQNAPFLGLIGGTDGAGNAFAGLVNPSEVLSFYPGPGEILSVASNTHGLGIIGGELNSNAYAALLNCSSGILFPPLGLSAMSSTKIRTVAMNNFLSPVCIIGGDDGNSHPYSALIFTNTNQITDISASLPQSAVQTVSINSSAQPLALVGGGKTQTSIEDGFCYLIYTDPQTPEIIPLTLGNQHPRINSSAISSSPSPIGLVGGVWSSAAPSAFLIYPNPLDHSMPTEVALTPAGIITTVAINSSSSPVGIIGGYNDLAATPYVALVYPDLVSPNLVDLSTDTDPLAKIINSVAINDSGMCLIGGGDFTDITPIPYAAIIQADPLTPTFTNLTLDIAEGVIDSVAISSEGIGILGGQRGSQTSPGSAYTALVSPTGIVTPVNLPLSIAGSSIRSVSVPSGVLVTISSSTFTSSAIFKGLSVLASTIFPNTVNAQIELATDCSKDDAECQEDVLLAQASETIALRYAEHPNQSKKHPFTFRVIPFGNLSRQQASKKIPSFKDEIAGITTTFDYRFNRHSLLGIGLSYAFDYVEVAEGLGHSKINEEFATLYASWNFSHLFINTALWGGLFQVNNERHTLPNFAKITSVSHTKGWLLSPHFEMAFPFNAASSWLTIDPFFMVDWANGWQQAFQERGASGLNISLEDQYSSLLRSEAGIRFYEVLQYNWGFVLFKEKASFVNKKPFHTGPAAAFFVGAPSSFAVETFGSQTENLGVAEFQLELIPRNPKYPYGTIDYQGEFGGSYSHTLCLEIRQRF